MIHLVKKINLLSWYPLKLSEFSTQPHKESSASNHRLTWLCSTDVVKIFDNVSIKYVSALLKNISMLNAVYILLIALEYGGFFTHKRKNLLAIYFPK